MDLFAVVLLGGVAAFVVCLWLLGRFYPGSGTERVPSRSAQALAERRDALEAEDLDHLLEASNARCRRRGLPERTREDAQREFGVPDLPGTRRLRD